MMSVNICKVCGAYIRQSTATVCIHCTRSAEILSNSSVSKIKRIFKNDRNETSINQTCDS